jgi:hypothetical protein
MKKALSFFIVFAATVASAQPAAKHKPLSPHETIKSVIDGDAITVVYGRPYTKSPKTGEIRKIWGGLVPYDQVWRTGADAATIFKTKKAIVMNGTAIPAGSYTLFTLPAKDGSAELIVNKETGQWGLAYNEGEDFARIELKKEPLAKSVDQFTMAVEKSGSGGGVLTLSWENIRYSAPFTVNK